MHIFAKFRLFERTGTRSSSVTHRYFCHSEQFNRNLRPSTNYQAAPGALFLRSKQGIFAVRNSSAEHTERLSSFHLIKLVFQ